MNRLLALSMVVVFAGCACPGIAADKATGGGTNTNSNASAPTTDSATPSGTATKSKKAKAKSAEPAKPIVNYFGRGSSAKPPPTHATNTRASFTVVGTDCYTCLNRMKRKIKRVKGVKNVHIMSWEPYEAAVSFDSTVTNWDEIAASIADEKVQLLKVKIEALVPKSK